MQRITAADYLKLSTQQSAPGKYGNKRVKEDGHTFGSGGMRNEDL